MKKNIAIYVIITLLACALTGTIIYILVDKKDNKTEIKENNNDKINNDNETNNNEEDNNNQNEEPTKQDGVKLLKTYNLNDKIIEEFEITLNGKTKNMNIVYEYKYEEDDDYFNHVINGKFNNLDFFTSSLQLEDNTGKKNKKEDIFNLNIVNNGFKENNFKIIKGKDNKNYLVVMADVDFSYGTCKVVYIFNDDLKLISEKSITDSYDFQYREKIVSEKDYFPYTNSFYSSPYKVQGLTWYGTCNDCDNSDVIFKIENNKIYYLSLVIPNNYKFNEMDKILEKAKIEEREYTINNNKLEYKVIKEYKVLEFAQSIY